MSDLLVKRCIVIMHASRELFSHAVRSCRTDTSNSYRPTVCSRFLSMRWSRVQPCCERDLDFPRHILQPRTPQHNTRLQPEGYGGARPQNAKQRGEPGDYRHSVLPELLQEWLPQGRLPQERLLQSPWWRGLAESMPKPTCLSVAASTSCRSMPPWTDQGIITRNWILTRETDGRRYIMVIHVTRETCRDKVGSDHTKKNAN